MRILLILFLSISIPVIIWWFWPEGTPSIKSDGSKAESSIQYIEIGGLEQCILVRSANINNPIILFLHGGPGMPLMYLAHEFQRPLEESFSVVQWDRRGAGKTFTRNLASKESMNVRQLIDDAYELIDILRNSYHKDKIVLVGHSFGTYLGSIMVKEKPELFEAYISIGQVVDEKKARVLQKDFIRKKALKYDRRDIIESMENKEGISLENWLFEFGGELKDSKSFLPLLWSGLKAPEYTLKDALNVGKGSSFSSYHMKYNVLENSIYEEIRDYSVPVYFLVGRSDYTTPHHLIVEYFNLINAPHKELIYFENSAHFPFYEEPEKFSRTLKKILLQET